MDYRVDISDLANIDIDNALARLRRHSGTAAEMWFGDLLEAIGSMERMPNRCPIAPETRSFFIEIRHLIFGERGLQHRIIFGVSIDEHSNDSVITIYRVRNSRQMPISDLELFGEYNEE